MNTDTEQQASMPPAPRAEDAPRDQRALGWFVIGAIVGAMIMWGVGSLSASKPAAPAAVAAAPEIDLAAIQAAAKKGAAEALAEQSDRPAPAQAADTAAANGPAKPVAMDTLPLRDANILGESNSVVTVIEYSDFGCVFCRRFHEQSFDPLVNAYLKTGKVRFMYKHYPITNLHPLADQAALASECAADQNKFWAYHDVLFAHNTEGFERNKLVAYAKDLTMDMPRFNKCLTDPKIAARVQTDIDEGSKLGVRGTPTFVINGQVIVGAQPTAVFQQAIDAALSKANGG